MEIFRWQHSSESNSRARLVQIPFRRLNLRVIELRLEQLLTNVSISVGYSLEIYLCCLEVERPFTLPI